MDITMENSGNTSQDITIQCQSSVINIFSLIRDFKDSKDKTEAILERLQQEILNISRLARSMQQLDNGKRDTHEIIALKTLLDKQETLISSSNEEIQVLRCQIDALTNDYHSEKKDKERALKELQKREKQFDLLNSEFQNAQYSIEQLKNDGQGDTGDKQWVCCSCTFINSSESTVCKTCNISRHPGC